MGCYGIDLAFSNSSAVEQMIVAGNGCGGIRLFKGTVRESTVTQNDGVGIEVSNLSLLENNLVENNSTEGMKESDPGGGSIVQGNRIIGNGEWGLRLGSRTGYSNNILFDNNGVSNEPAMQITGGLKLGENLCEGVPCP